ncbi:MAG: hypothetical protein V3W41_09530 [Planctomycetota bacterium]
MSQFDVEFLSLALATVGLFFICCAVLQKKPKHVLAELFGVNKRGLRDLKSSVFKRNQVVMGFLCVVMAIVVDVFIAPAPDADGILEDLSPGAKVLALIAFLVALCGILNYLSRLWSKAAFKRLVFEVVTEYQWPFEENMVLTKEIGKLLGVPQSDDDTVEAYVARIRKHLKIP